MTKANVQMFNKCRGLNSDQCCYQVVSWVSSRLGSNGFNSYQQAKFFSGEALKSKICTMSAHWEIIKPNIFSHYWVKLTTVSFYLSNIHSSKDTQMTDEAASFLKSGKIIRYWLEKTFKVLYMTMTTMVSTTTSATPSTSTTTSSAKSSTTSLSLRPLMD